MIKVKNLTKTFTTNIKEEIVLKSIDMAVKKGELVTIMGPSGGGKSTFLYVLGLMSKPSSGEVYLNGKKVDYTDDEGLDKYRKRRIGIVFQNPVVVNTLSPIENLTIAMRTNESRKQKVLRAKRLLKEVGLKSKENQEVRSLSREEVQRVAAARSLVNYPKIILCDEPFGTLNSKERKNIIDIFLRYRERNNTTLIIATHDMNIAELGNRKFYLEDGELNEIC